MAELTVRTRRDHAAAAERANALADWRERGLCVGRAGLFNVRPGTSYRKTPEELAAIRLCMDCPVIKQCTADVLRLPGDEDFGGIVAGLTERERTKLRRKGGKRCPDCRKVKALSEYTPSEHKPRGVRTYCKPCEAARQRAARAAGRQPEMAS